jgi:uncharacterized membrane protein HdeD (DUF308 family)
VSTATAEGPVYNDSAGSVWWVFLVTGTAWLILSLVLFRFNETSVNTIGILCGIVFLIAGVIEFGMIFVVQGTWWKILNALLAVLLILGGIFSFIHPSNAFTAIASITGFMFLFVGILDIIVALADRSVGLWWIRLITGLLCVGLAFWASGDFDRKAILLTVWIALFCLLRGINSFIVAFTVRELEHEARGA